jgi:hypothetical protein
VNLAVRAIRQALAWLAREQSRLEGRAGASAQTGGVDWAALHGLFDESPGSPRARAHRAARGMEIARRYGPGRALAWWRAPHKARIAAALLPALDSLAAARAGDVPEASFLLTRAYEALGTAVVPGRERAPAQETATSRPEWAVRWRTLRGLVGLAFLDAVRLGDPHARERMLPVLAPALGLR